MVCEDHVEALHHRVDSDGCWAILGRLVALSVPKHERLQSLMADPVSVLFVMGWQRCSSNACHLFLGNS